MDEEKSLPVSLMAAGAVGVILLLVLTVWMLRRSGTEPPATIPPTMTQEQQDSLRQIEFENLEMSAVENFLGDTVNFLDMQIPNRGIRAVVRRDLQLAFHDVMNREIYRETAQPIHSRTKPLEAGETRDVQLAFDKLLEDRNSGPPTITPIYVGAGEEAEISTLPEYGQAPLTFLLPNVEREYPAGRP